MSGYVIRNREGQYVKSLNTEDHILEFTNKPSEAKIYDGGSWFAETELDFLKFHFKEFKDILDTMEPRYEENL